MTPPLYAGLEDQLLTLLDDLEPHALLGWLTPAQVTSQIPEPPDFNAFDLVVRRLARAGRVELWNPDYPPSAHRQMLRLLA